MNLNIKYYNIDYEKQYLIHFFGKKKIKRFLLTLEIPCFFLLTTDCTEIFLSI